MQDGVSPEGACSGSKNTVENALNKKKEMKIACTVATQDDHNTELQPEKLRSQD